MIKFNYIIYHKKCFDGFTSFYLFTKTNNMEPKPIVYPDIPSTKIIPPDIDGKNIIIMDVAYNKNILQQIFKKANKVLFLDHHITIRKDVIELQKKLTDKEKKNIEIIYDINKSGATLVWDYFFKNKKRPYFVNMIEDNDIGKWEMIQEQLGKSSCS